MRSAFRFLPALALMAVIFILSSTPSRELPDFGFWNTLVKKGGHFFGYAVLALTYLYALSTPEGGHKVRTFILAFGLALLYAVSDEYHQSFVPGRHPSWVDAFLIDSSGAALALWVARLVQNKKK